MWTLQPTGKVRPHDGPKSEDDLSIPTSNFSRSSVRFAETIHTLSWHKPNRFVSILGCVSNLIHQFSTEISKARGHGSD